jgi:cytoskeletal protein CcmA (bactofilin family)
VGTRRKLVILAVFVTGLVGLGSWLGRQIFARPLVDSEHVIFTPGETYHLTSLVENPLVVLAHGVLLDTDSRIAGDSAFIGETVTAAGQVNGDITLMGDNVAVSGHVTGDASLIGSLIVVDGQVDGDMTVVGERLSIAQEARINGKVVACVDSLTDARTEGRVEPCGNSEAFSAVNTGLKFDQALWGAGFSTVALVVSGFMSLVLSGVGALAVAVFPRQFSTIEEAILTGPRRVAQTGFLAFLLAIGITVGVLVVLAAVPPLGMVLLPVFLIAAIVFLGMTMTGWVTVALIIGNWLLRRSTRAIVPPLIAAVVGSVLLFLLWHVVSLAPFGIVAVLLAMAVLGSIGLGAALRTRMGTRSVGRRYFVQG